MWSLRDHQPAMRSHVREPTEAKADEANVKGRWLQGTQRTVVEAIQIGWKSFKRLYLNLETCIHIHVRREGDAGMVERRNTTVAKNVPTAECKVNGLEGESIYFCLDSAEEKPRPSLLL